jgi:hypothetical protein
MKATALLAPAAVAGALTAIGCAPGDGMRFQVINMERPDDAIGMAAPADYRPCYVGEARAYDTDGDGHVDRVRVGIDGKDRCYGEDTDHDGRIDTWDVTDETGRITRRAHDANGDGRADQVWTFDPARTGCASVASDVDGDGHPDPGSPFDICQHLARRGLRPGTMGPAMQPVSHVTPLP